VVLADDPFAVLHQIDKEIKDLRLHRNQCRAAPQLAPADIECKFAEEEPHGRPAIRTRNRSRGIIRAISRIKQASRKAFKRGRAHPPSMPIAPVAVETRWRTP